MANGAKKPNAVEWATLIVLIVATIGGGFKFWSADKQIADLQIQDATQPVLQMSAIADLTYPTMQNVRDSKVVLCTLRLNVENIGNAEIRIGKVNVSLERAEVDGEIARMVADPPGACPLDTCVEAIAPHKWTPVLSNTYMPDEVAGSKTLRKNQVGALHVPFLLWEGAKSEILRFKIVASPPADDESWQHQMAVSEVALGPLRSAFGPVRWDAGSPFCVEMPIDGTPGRVVVPLEMEPVPPTEPMPSTEFED